MIDFINLNNCVTCNSSNIIRVIDLGKQPLANSFSNFPKTQQEFPLELMRCFECGHLQLSVSVDRSSIFTDYIYRSGTTNTLKSYFDWFAKEMTNRHGVGRVLDIACNDGTQLDSFRKLGWQTFGVDPAENLSQFNTHDHRVAFFDEGCLDLGQFDIIIAQNVVAHTDNPDTIVRVAGQMTENLYIQTSQAKMIDRGEFDTIYHEHISFFSPLSMASLAKRCDLGLKSVEIVPIHGDSFLFRLGKGSHEVELTTYSNEQVQNFSINTHKILSNLKSAILECDHIVGYGAAAKAMTVLNAAGIGPSYIIDDAQEKQYKFTPLLNIPILPIDVLKYESDEICLIPLAWNFSNEIAERVRKVYDGKVHVLKYFPEVAWEWQQ